MRNLLTSEKILPYALLGLTAATGLIDAVSFLSLGHVFTANMTGNVVLLGFASTGAAELSVYRSLAALFGFLAGAAVGGRIMVHAARDSQFHLALVAFAVEIAFLAAATFCAIGHSTASSQHSLQVYGVIALTALAMGTRNAAVRKLAVPDLTTTVLTLTLTGIAADSSLAGGANPRLARRVASVLVMLAGAALGAMLIKRSVSAALGVAAGISAASSLALLQSLRLSPPPEAL